MKSLSPLCRFVLGALLVAMAAGGTSCLFRAQPQLVLRTDPMTVTRKLQELASERGARQQAASSYVVGQPVGNSRFVIYGLGMSDRERYQTIVAATEVEVVPYGKGLTQLRARTLHPIVSSLPASNPTRESEALRLCADYIDRGVKPAGRQVVPFELWQQQSRTNELNRLPRPGVPPADWTKPELKLR